MSVFEFGHSKSITYTSSACWLVRFFEIVSFVQSPLFLLWSPANINVAGFPAADRFAAFELLLLFWATEVSLMGALTAHMLYERSCYGTMVNCGMGYADFWLRQRRGEYASWKREKS